MKLPLFAISTLSQPYYFFTTTLLLGNVKIDYKYDEYFRWKCDKQKSWGNVGGFHISIFIQPSRKTDVDEENKRMMDENEDLIQEVSSRSILHWNYRGLLDLPAELLSIFL